MSGIPVPTRQEVVNVLEAVLDGTSSRLAAAEWAAEVQENIESEDPEAVDPDMWHLLQSALPLNSCNPQRSWAVSLALPIR